MRKSNFLRRFLAATLLSLMPVAAMSSGTVTSATGATVTRAGAAEVALTPGATLQAGDTINTGARGRARWRMADGSDYTMGSNATLRIDEFALSRPQQNVPGRAVMSLLKGAFRGVSGLVGKFSRDTYEIRTPVATMGIRGTTYEISYCTGGGCTGADGQPLPDGLYVRVDVGRVVVTTPDGASIEVVAGQTAFVAGGGAVPTLVDNILIQGAGSVDASVDGPAPVRIEPDKSASPS